jgi:hypothetical protein
MLKQGFLLFLHDMIEQGEAMRLFTLITLLSATTLAACSTSKDTYGRKPPYSRDFISQEEIHRSSATNAYDLIRTLRPHWLRGRGTKSIKYEQASYPVVYVNGARHGGIGSLSTISVENITRIRFLNAGDASNQLGMNHPSGAIMISLFD